MEIIKDPIQYERTLIRDKFMGYRIWAEIRGLEDPAKRETCYRCNKPLEPLSPLDPEFFTLPCWDCVGKKRTERELVVESVIRNIRDFYMGKVLGDRYFQLFMIDPIYFANTLPHAYPEFKRVISKLNPPSRNDIWFLDWVPGFPKIISGKNLEGLKIVNLSSHYTIELDKKVVKVDDYEIRWPEEIRTGTRHRTRYGIFSQGNDNRKSKRLKLGDHCYQLYNTDNLNIKSIFKLYRRGEEVAFRSLGYQDYVILKLALLRDRSFLKFVFDILSELTRQISVFRDAVFLKNTVLIDPKKTSKLNLVWNPISDEVMSDYVNISLLS